jgi:hypothetical protein
MVDDLKFILESLNNKVESIDSRLDRVDITLAKQSVVLAEHVKRSNAIEAKLVPVEKHVQKIEGVIQALGVVSLLVAVVSGILKIFHIL